MRAPLLALLGLSACGSADSPEAREIRSPPETAAAAVVPDLAGTEEKLRSSDVALDDQVGRKVVALGDLDADGYADLAVGVYNDDDNGAYSGSVYLYFGSATGLAAASEQKLIASDGDVTDYFGGGLASAGDLDGDGYLDLLVGAAGNDDADNNAGAVYVYYGSATGAVESSEQKFVSSDVTNNDAFGSPLSSAGDLDGDGFDDIAVGVPGDTALSYMAGAVYVYYGSVSGLDEGTETLLQVAPGGYHAYLGYSLAHGDLDGDGYDDLVASAPSGYSGAAFVYLGSATGVVDGSHTTLRPSDYVSGSVGFGASLAVADFDDNGFDDLAVGATGDDDFATNGGALYVYAGTASGLDSSSELEWAPSDVAAGDGVGSTISAGSDVDGDGFPDLLVGSRLDAWSSLTDAGSAYLYYGSAGGLNYLLEDKLVASDAADSDYFGRSVAGVGDLDADGFGDLVVGAPGDDRPPDGGSVYVFYGSCRDVDEDGHCVEDDCDDEDSAVGLADTWYADSDGDGYGDPASSTESCDQPTDYVADATDCDDADSGVNPGETEVCDAADTDEDCSGSADDADSGVDGSTRSDWYADTDGDGYGDAGSTVRACNQPSGHVADGTDCDDADAGVNPGGTEVCDAADTDEDCSGAADDADSGVDGSTRADWYADTDGDGYGDAGSTVQACNQPSGHVADDTDCDDADAGVNPGGTEVCDVADTDEDCSGAADDADSGVDPTSRTAWYTDADGDGFGDAATVRGACDPASSEVADATDCDDTDPAVHPDATEVCDAADTDEDCSGAADDADSGVDPTSRTVWYTDADGDGFGDAATVRGACDPASTEVADATDCDDADPAVHPDATEVCDDADTDEDCSGAADDADPGVDPSTTGAWFTDSDGDGYGDPATGADACDPASTQVADATDCDDARADVNPGATEVCDALDADEDCSGTADDADPGVDPSSQVTWYADSDGDGYGDPAAPVEACDEATGRVADGTDCDDGDDSVWPGAEELEDDGVDQDCDGEDAQGPRDESGKGSCATGAVGPGSAGLVLIGLVGVLRRRAG